VCRCKYRGYFIENDVAKGYDSQKHELQKPLSMRDREHFEVTGMTVLMKIRLMDGSRPYRGR
jgi:hypothetical protein